VACGNELLALAAYHELLFDPDPGVHGPAGVAWTTWEAATVHLHFNQADVDEMSDPAFALAFARAWTARHAKHRAKAVRTA